MSYDDGARHRHIERPHESSHRNHERCVSHISHRIRYPSLLIPQHHRCLHGPVYLPDRNSGRGEVAGYHLAVTNRGSRYSSISYLVEMTRFTRHSQHFGCSKMCTTWIARGRPLSQPTVVWRGGNNESVVLGTKRDNNSPQDNGATALRTHKVHTVYTYTYT